MIRERQVARVNHDQWAAAWQLSQEYGAIEQEWRFPRWQHFHTIKGPEADTIVFEREWDSLSMYEAVHLRVFADGRCRTLGQRCQDVFEKAYTQYIYHFGEAEAAGPRLAA
jgi:hypothetical protein